MNCPALVDNRTAYRELARKLDDWLELLTVSGTPISVLHAVDRDAAAWIEHHIVTVDCRLRGCTSERDT